MRGRDDDGDDASIAAALVAELRGLTNWDEYSTFESAEVVQIGDKPGIAMTWTQRYIDHGPRAYGVLVTVARLRSTLHGERGASEIDDLCGDLQLLVEEPRGTTAPEGVRTWVRDFEPDPPPTDGRLRWWVAR